MITIEITMVDIICRIVAAISVFLCVVLCCYERHETAKWFKENLKDEEVNLSEIPTSWQESEE